MSVFSNPISRAPDEAHAYTSAILELLGDRDPISVLEQTPARLRENVDDLSPAQIRQPEGPDKWSITEVAQHLADSELVWAYRLRRVVAEDRPTLTGFDQDAWALRLAYRSVPIGDALDQFEVVRRVNLRFLKGLLPEAFDRVGVHIERGEERLDHMVRLNAGHDLVHIRQVVRIGEVLRTGHGA